MDIKPANYGFQAPENITPDHYILGASPLPQEVLQVNGDWSAFLPEDEIQRKNGLETMNCSNYGTLHVISTLHFRKWPQDGRKNYSERYTGVMTGTTPAGNDPHKVAEIIRTVSGLIDEIHLPFGPNIETWQEYYSPSPMSDDLTYKGKIWLATYTLGHEWVFSFGTPVPEKHQKMMWALEYSPLGASVNAWSQNDDGKYFKNGPDNHWIEVYDYIENQCWKVFDTYDNTHKELVWDFDFGFVKRYSLNRTLTPVIPPEPMPTTEGKDVVTLIGEFIRWILNEIFK